ncbi:hypothetical protein [Actinomadura rudentiformis]|uniref:FAD/NAD(P)-binding domain-containing protein n=1 Tax=Actinomadura rudentiformis TaxID=359158 RepID=A0A6H9YKE5_9ACTN|nr:hypothetical protein [Actinomadura rudentiformis]KAB2340618.1 hypothetical protein F8566_44675 [Actinomadura rudentiformis]
MEGGFQIFTDAGVQTADVVINAVNPPPHSIPENTGALISSLLASRAAEPHPDGGLNVETATGRLTVSGQADPRLYAMGDLAGDRPFITTSIAGLAARAEATAQALLAS